MINTTDTEYILNSIESKLTDPPQLEHLPFNKWLISSAMQKTIRRGESDRAIQFAVNLFHSDKRMLWRRLAIIALEDIGIGDAGAVTETLAISASTAWRRKAGDLKTAVYATQRMAMANKSRSTTHAYFVTEVSHTCQNARDQLSGLEVGELEEIVQDQAQRPSHRILALWFLAGTDRYPADRLAVREGDFSLAAELMTKMKAPVPVIQSCILHLKKTRYPLALFTPLMFELYGGQEHQITENDQSPTELVQGLPLYAMDGLYTRDGKACISLWKKQTSDLMEYTAKQIATALFFVEGGILDKELLNKRLKTLKDAATACSFFLANIPTERQQALIQLVENGLPDLNKIRQEYLGTQQ